MAIPVGVLHVQQAGYDYLGEAGSTGECSEDVHEQDGKLTAADPKHHVANMINEVSNYSAFHKCRESLE
jgi:hypothetical protein